MKKAPDLLHIARRKRAPEIENALSVLVVGHDSVPFYSVSDARIIGDRRTRAFSIPIESEWALIRCLIAFSRRKPVSTLLENAIGSGGFRTEHIPSRKPCDVRPKTARQRAGTRAIFAHGP
jgi:hypothetical protein